LRLLSVGLGARIHLTLWVNGERVYAGHLTNQPVPVRAQLRHGWNTLVFKSNHRTWEWQNTIELTPVEGESLDDLRFATRNRPHNHPEIWWSRRGSTRWRSGLHCAGREWLLRSDGESSAPLPARGISEESPAG